MGWAVGWDSMEVIQGSRVGEEVRAGESLRQPEGLRARACDQHGERGSITMITLSPFPPWCDNCTVLYSRYCTVQYV